MPCKIWFIQRYQALRCWHMIKDVVTPWLQRLFDVIALKLQSHLKINYYLKREQNF